MRDDWGVLKGVHNADGSIDNYEFEGVYPRPEAERIAEARGDGWIAVPVRNTTMLDNLPPAVSSLGKE